MNKNNHKQNGLSVPKISIILPCYNSAKTIEQTIQSIIHLNYPNIEFVVIDGESTDGTLNILNRYTQFINCLISEKDNGIYDAMNKGVRLANGDYLYFIGSDDIVINSWQNLDKILKSGNTIYYGNVYFPSSNMIFDGKFNFVNLLTKNLCHQSIFYPKAVFEKYHYSTDYPLLADFHLNLVLNSDSNFKFKFIDIIVAIYSENGLSSTGRDSFFLQNHLEIIKKHYSFIVYLYIYTRKILAKCLKKDKYE